MENHIWDDWQLGVVIGVFGTVDRLIIDRSIIEEMKNMSSKSGCSIL